MVAVPEEAAQERFAVEAEVAVPLTEPGVLALEQDGAGGGAGDPDVAGEGAVHSQLPFTPET